MEVKLVKSQGLENFFEITIDSPRIETALNNKLVSLQKTAKISGFRPGKVPFELIKTRYADSKIADVIKDIIDNSTREILKQHEIKTAGTPIYDVLTPYEAGKNFVFSLRTESLPVIADIDFPKLKLSQVAVNVQDKDVEANLLSIVKSKQKTRVLTENRAVKNGDVVKINLQGYWNEQQQESIPESEVKNFFVELGANKMLASIEEKILGNIAPAVIKANIQFPDDFADEELAGTEAFYVIELLELHEYVESILDDSVAKDLGFDSLDALRESVKEKIETQLAKSAFDYNKRMALDGLDKAISFEIPASMKTKELEFLQQQHANTAQNDDTLALTAEQYDTIAARRVKLGLLLSEIGSKNSVKVEEKDVIEVLLERASAYPGHENSVIEFYRKNAQAMDSIRAAAFENCVVKFIIANAATDVEAIDQKDLERKFQELSDF